MGELNNLPGKADLPARVSTVMVHERSGFPPPSLAAPRDMDYGV